MLKPRALAVLLCCLPGIVMASDRAAAQEAYPAKPVRFVVPYAAGGTTDILGRTLAIKLEAKWKQTVYVENLPGGGGLNGAGTVAKATPDGYTLVIVTPSHVINPTVMTRPPFDPIKNFTAVTLLGKSSSLLLANNQSGIKSLADLVARARDKIVNYGTSGIGSKHHIAMLEFARLSGSKLVHIPYRGSSQAMNDLIGGHLVLQMGGTAFGATAMNSGQAKALAVVNDRRSRLAPEVPTFSELGYPLVSSEWWALLAPAGMPRPIVDKIAADVADVLKMADVQARIPTDELVSSSPDELQAFLQSEATTWGKVAKDAGLRFD